MPVYNGERYLREAVDSVLGQDFSDYELLIINDASTDASAEIIRAYRNPRIRLIQNRMNLGLAKVRNVGLSEAVGEYLAWLDCDDVSAPTRLAEQVEFLDTHQSVALCGSWVKTIGNKTGEVWRYPTEAGVLRSRMLFDDPIATSAAMVRRAVLMRFGLRFDDRFPLAEDYDMWERVSQYAEVANIPKVLTFYRVHADQISNVNPLMGGCAVWEIQERQLMKLGIQPSEAERELHTTIGVKFHFLGDRNFVNASAGWLHRLADANARAKVYPEKAFKNVLAERWYGICRMASRHGFFAWRQFWDSPLAGEWRMSTRGMVRFWITCGMGAMRGAEGRSGRK
jgi:glycosyltransferase involved in cell wall biosynthesis